MKLAAFIRILFVVERKLSHSYRTILKVHVLYTTIEVRFLRNFHIDLWIVMCCNRLREHQESFRGTRFSFCSDRFIKLRPKSECMLLPCGKDIDFFPLFSTQPARKLFFNIVAVYFPEAILKTWLNVDLV